MLPMTSDAAAEYLAIRHVGDPYAPTHICSECVHLVAPNTLLGQSVKVRKAWLKLGEDLLAIGQSAIDWLRANR